MLTTIRCNAGKPIFTLHGKENALAGFMAAIHAMVSFAADRNDPLQSIRHGPDALPEKPIWNACDESAYTPTQRYLSLAQSDFPSLTAGDMLNEYLQA